MMLRRLLSFFLAAVISFYAAAPLLSAGPVPENVACIEEGEWTVTPVTGVPEPRLISLGGIWSADPEAVETFPPVIEQPPEYSAGSYSF
jgi:hypothetical protein